MKSGLITESFTNLNKIDNPQALRKIAKSCFALPEAGTVDHARRVSAPSMKVKVA